jgi:plasmid stability protein
VTINAAADDAARLNQLLAEAAMTPLPDDDGLSAERAEELISMAARAYTSSPYTSLMAMTTIRVEAEIRDRLAARASEHGRSLGAELKAMLDEMMWQGIEAGYRRLAADQEEMAAYQAEAAEWTSADIGNLAASAAEEYPEYNS